jgi:hypothetical protein
MRMDWPAFANPCLVRTWPAAREPLTVRRTGFGNLMESQSEVSKGRLMEPLPANVSRNRH